MYFWLFFNGLKQVPIHFSCLGECHYDVKLQKCLVDNKLHLTFHPHDSE